MESLFKDIIADIANEKSYEAILDAAFTAAGISNPTSSLWSSSYGINFNDMVSGAKPSKENNGFTLFARPCFNLSYDNVSNNRIIKPIATDQDPSWMRATRALFDSYANIGWKRPVTITSKLVDPLSPFIPMFTNELVSISGFPDRTMDYFQSQPGRANESIFIPDGIYDINNIWTANASFRLLPGNPILYMFGIWLCYTALVHDGLMSQYQEDDVEQRMGYTTSIWRIVTDESKQRVLRFGRTGYALPTAFPEGAAFSYEVNRTFMNVANQIDVSFACAGWVTNDVGYIQDFNRLSHFFNPGLGAAFRWPRLTGGYKWSNDFPGLYYDSQFDYFKLDPYFFNMFTTQVYLWINLQDGWTLERWVPGDVFRSKVDLNKIGIPQMEYGDLTTINTGDDFANMV